MGISGGFGVLEPRKHHLSFSDPNMAFQAKNAIKQGKERQKDKWCPFHACTPPPQGPPKEEFERTEPMEPDPWGFGVRVRVRVQVHFFLGGGVRVRVWVQVRGRGGGGGSSGSSSGSGSGPGGKGGSGLGWGAPPPKGKF